MDGVEMAIDISETPSRVCGVVVTFNPDLAVFADLLRGVLPQVDELVVVDNGSNAEFLAWLRRVISPGVLVCELTENVGVGAAHNVGIRIARRRGHAHVLLLDHDSVPDREMVPRLLEALSRSTTEAPIAAVGPAYVDPRTGRVGRFIGSTHPPGQSVVDVEFLITSGSLIPIRVFDAVGEFDAGLFVDYVDTDWCLRAVHSGFRLQGVPEATMRHTIGEGVSRVLGFSIPDYSPRRLYYQARNPLLLSWKTRVRTLCRMLRLMLYYGILRGPRLRNVAMLFRGIRDGLRRRAGRRDLADNPTAWAAILDRAERSADSAVSEEPHDTAA